jgi:hypothetical protein
MVGCIPSIERAKKMSEEFDIQQCNGLKSNKVKIMTQAAIMCEQSATAVFIRRGMVLTSFDQKQAGKVAGIALGSGKSQVKCLIIYRLPLESGYQSLPASWVARVQGEVIFLNVNFEKVLALPVWHSV